MDWRIFASTFVLIFLAELGDKTQLAALAATVGSKSTCSVFAGAALALVLSTLIAVFAGEALQRVVPPTALKLAAGILFLVFGVVLLAGTLRGAARDTAVLPTSARPGLIARWAIEAAVTFEAAAQADYARLAAASEDANVRRILAALAAEEQGHLRHLNALLATHPDGEVATPQLPPRPAPALEKGSSASASDVLADAARQEQMAAAFFQKLADAAVLPALKSAFGQLAVDEHAHARRLNELLRG